MAGASATQRLFSEHAHDSSMPARTRFNRRSDKDTFVQSQSVAARTVRCCRVGSICVIDQDAGNNALRAAACLQAYVLRAGAVRDRKGHTQASMSFTN